MHARTHTSTGSERVNSIEQHFSIKLDYFQALQVLCLKKNCCVKYVNINAIYFI
jgi:hypothetical protein